jgi:hypothetical protein
MSDLSSNYLAFITALIAGVNALAIIYDIRRRHTSESAHYVQVPNKNEGGIEEFRTEADRRAKQPANAARIAIKADNTVEITHLDGRVSCYNRYVRWER